MQRALGIGLCIAVASCSSKEDAKRTHDDESASSATATATATVSAAEAASAAPAGSAQASTKTVRPGDPDYELARSAALRDALEFGMIGMLNTGGVEPWKRDGAPGTGFGSGTGRAKPPTLRMGATSVSGRLPPEVIQRIVRQNFGRYRLCYEAGLKKDPKLAGKITVSFTIGRDGKVSGVGSNSDMSDASVVSCVAKAFETLTFPEPEAGVVKVSYPIVFTPADDASAATGTSTAVVGPTIGSKPLDQATSADVEKALRDAGYTDITSQLLTNTVAVTVFTVKKGDKTFTVTFVPASAGANALPETELERLKSVASVRQTGNFFLAVESEDKAAAKALLDELVKGA
ncbi:MAG: AgmX/PglI C-terminal domain-containing protein [Polyangiaceae bacterium]|nr:AgmX/PglI C-terminal domain-containing protein [Polyangiaceae bacterium]